MLIVGSTALLGATALLRMRQRAGGMEVIDRVLLRSVLRAFGGVLGNGRLLPGNEDSLDLATALLTIALVACLPRTLYTSITASRCCTRI
jgi:hypothetical protein